MPSRPSSRLLVLDLRTRRYGYAVLDGLHRLMGWGFRRHARANNMAVSQHLTRLHSQFKFDKILARKRTEIKGQTLQTELVQDVLRFGLSAQLPVHLIGAEQIRAFFGRKPKYEISKLIATRFPEVSWKLPPKRRPWQTESDVQSIFDAIGTAVYFLESLAQPIPSDSSELA